MGTFLLDKSVTADMGTMKDRGAVRRAVERFYRDLDMVVDGDMAFGGGIELCEESMEPEQYRILVEEKRMVICAGDELGFVYALLHLSEAYMGILPFWFWNDQKFEKRDVVEIPVGTIASSPYPVRYRGWFLNDEVLISRWDGGVSKEYPWEMAFEALLRLGGNLVIPGTDANSKIYAELAAEMGLWITHHHAEPLGAEMFARVYPDKTPSFAEYPELFYGLWEEGIQRQKNYRVIWNIGFRGQGDRPFWDDDPQYDTPKKRGDLISSLMVRQYELVKKYVENPVFCTNLYGETMELYQQGFLTLPEDVITIWADNGYGKMVSRRQGNHNPRVPALPPAELRDGNHGTYYHVSFYDLQAANHITMLPNSMEFVEKELKIAYDCGIKSLWVVNCSNVKPHVYPLDFIGNLWRGNSLTAEAHRRQYVESYYAYGQRIDGNDFLESLQDLFEAYFDCTVPYGNEEDERAGDQFYNYVTRDFVCRIMKDGGRRPEPELNWFAPGESLEEQMEHYRKTVAGGKNAFEPLLEACSRMAEQAGPLMEDSLLLQVKIHTYCLRGAVSFCDGYEAYEGKQYLKAFYLFGRAADWYEAADRSMREREHGKWKGFYENDCLCDVKETACCLRRLMGYIRNLGDGPHFYEWQREVTYSEEDKRVVLITNMENHMTDQELYQAMKERESDEKALGSVGGTV